MNYRNLRAVPGSRTRLANLDPGFTHGFKSKQSARKKLETDRERLSELQAVFYAAQRYALLIVFQGMDGAGKDSSIKHVMSGVNPQGVDVFNFRQPSAEELKHDFLWRCAKVLPARGKFGIFNRSYYEEVLVTRVHPKLLQQQGLPASVREEIWSERFEDINAFERHLVRNGTLIIKFFLHLSKREQRLRFLKRLDEPEKHWKFSASDIAERDYWDSYARAYEDMIQHTSTVHAPWYIIPADHKWFAHAAIGDVLVSVLRELNLSYPKLGRTEAKALARAKKKLERER